MKLLLLLLLTFSKVHTQPQVHWRVVHNGISKLKTGTEDLANNTIGITTSSLKKAGHLSVEYAEAESRKDWERFFVIRNLSGAELLQRKSKRLKLDNATLNKWAKRNKKILVYTYALPTDPDIRARVRVRSVHLCTLVIK